MKSRLDIAVLTTYPPTECGIATFSQSLVHALNLSRNRINIVRLMNAEETASPKSVIHDHYYGNNEDLTIEVLNQHDLVIVQHEFGIFGGEDGEEIVSLLENIDVPVIAVLHTVVSSPTANQRKIVDAMTRRAGALVVMTQAGKAKLIAGYSVDASKIHVIPHGARPMKQPITPMKEHSVNHRPRILTWGLLGPGKGIEWAIDALKELKDLEIFPEYVIAGQTHPHVKQHQGEAYRDGLKQKIADHNLEDHVTFMDHYLSETDLDELISSADVIVLPYDSIEQVTSGVLVEALVAGKPIIATNFPHARELLFDKSGILVNQKDSHGIAQGIRSVLGSKHRTHAMQSRMNRKSTTFLWSSVASKYLDIADELATTQQKSQLQSLVS